MHEYLTIRQSRRLENRISLLGLFIGVPSLIIMFLTMNIGGLLSKWTWPKAGLICFGGGFLISGVLAWLLRKS